MSQHSSKQKHFNSGNRGRGFHRGKGNWNNQSQRNGPRKDRPKAEQLCEQDVGITEYVSKEPGFSGIIKARFSDFQVNEIDCDGNVAKLTNTDVPEYFNEVLTEQTEVRPPIIPELAWEKIKLLSEKESSGEVIFVEVTNASKEERTAVHEVIKRCFEKKIVVNTVNKDDKKFMQFKKYIKCEALYDRRVQWPNHIPQFVHFLVYKESLDTMEACYKIADCLRIRVDNFAYAGVKDKRAKTTQWMSVRKVLPEKLLQKTKPLRNVKIGNICFKNKPLRLGKLKGNRFRIALRNVTADDETINKAMESLKVNGFINYYGMQRFGNDKEVPTYLIGVKLLQGNFKEACDLILKLKVSDDPDSDITAAKKVYNQTRDAKQSCEKFGWNKNKCLEYKLLEGLSKHAANDYVNSLENIPRSTRKLYIHAFQSLVWNKIVSKRIEEFGLQPIVGDLVLLEKEQLNGSSTVKEDVTEDTESDDDLEDGSKDDAPKAEAVKVLCEEDLDKYSIYDIVLPLPGFDVKYPENKVKDWYKEILQENGLELEMPKQKVRMYSLSGKYRKIIEKAMNLSWSTLQYNDPNYNLIRSDYEELQGEEEPKSVPDGQYKSLIIDMCLNSAIYATMVLREVLKTDTSSASQTKLNDYHVKEKTDAEPSNKSEKSLLDNPDKFALFKQMVFDDDNDAKRKNEDKLDSGDRKRPKTEEENKESGKQTIIADVI